MGNTICKLYSPTFIFYEKNPANNSIGLIRRFAKCAGFIVERDTSARKTPCFSGFFKNTDYSPSLFGLLNFSS